MLYIEARSIYTDSLTFKYRESLQSAYELTQIVRVSNNNKIHIDKYHHSD